MTGHIGQIKKRCVSLLVRKTGRPSLLVERDLAEEIFLTADGAVQYGIADEILMKKEKNNENDL